MPEPLPATLIAGFNSAAKGRVIDALLQYKPEGEQWALIAPASLLGSPRYAPGAAPAGLWVETVAPGCPCCTGLTPFSAGLTGLLRRLRDQPVTRLLIEGGNEGHVGNVARLLAREELRAHVVLTHVLAVIDPAWLAKPQAAAQIALRELANAADSLVASPWDEGDALAATAMATPAIAGEASANNAATQAPAAQSSARRSGAAGLASTAHTAADDAPTKDSTKINLAADNAAGAAAGGASGRLAFAAFAASLTPPKPWAPLAAGALETAFAHAALRGIAADASCLAQPDIQPFPLT